MRIAVDAFGGDNAPAAVVEGCVDALKSIPICPSPSAATRSE